MYLHCRSLIVLHSYLVVRKDIFTPHACNKPQEKKSLNTRICSDIDSTMYCVYVHNGWHLKVKTKITSSHHKPGIVREDWLLGFCCQLNNAYTCTICTLYNVLKTYYYLQRLTASFIILIVLKLRFTIRLNKIMCPKEAVNYKKCRTFSIDMFAKTKHFPKRQYELHH